VREALLNLLAAFGLVPARRYRSLARQVEELRDSAQSWKARAGEAQARAKSLERDVSRQTRLVKEARRTVQQGTASDADVARLREQLAATERELMLAREHLMSIEVKLDILEGAANVLDARTRVAIQQSTRTGATV
jgi:hypothetical protein